jgi:hypothetical protein
MEQNNIYTRNVGGKEQNTTFIERKIIYTRNGDVGGKEQILAVMEQKIIYTRNGDVGGKEQNISYKRNRNEERKEQ